MILRRFALFTVALVASVACYMALGSVAEKNSPAIASAAACTYGSYERQNTASVSFYSPYLGRTDYLYNRLTTWDGTLLSGVSCGNYKRYELQQWTAYGTPGSYYSNIRVWVCGPYIGSYSIYSATDWSPEIYYPGTCGRQADNSGSYFYDTTAGVYHSVYVNQG